MPFFRVKRLILVIVACLFIVSCSFTFYFMPKSDELDLLALFEHRHDHDEVILMKKSISQDSPLVDKNPVLVARDPKHRLDVEKLNRLENLVDEVIENSKNALGENNKVDDYVITQFVEPLHRTGTYDFNRGTPTDPDLIEKRNTIKQMMKTAWDGYKQFAWGASEVKPISKQRHKTAIFGNADTGATIVDALDTLYLMGMTKEFDEGREWARNLQLKSHYDLSVFEVNIRFIGGFLSAYALSNDATMLTKAREIADLLMPAFDTPTGIPFALFNPTTKKTRNYSWASGGKSVLSEFGTLHLEFAMLTKYTGDPKYLAKVMKIRDYIHEKQKEKGLYMNYIDPRSGAWGQRHVSLGALGDSFYEYLLKAWILSGKKDTTARVMYDEAVKALEAHVITTSSGGMVYAGEWKNGRLEPKMQHLTCFSGGMFALGSKGSSDPEHFMKLGADLTHTCHESYDRSETKLGPESFGFSGGREAVAISQRDKHYLLRPEVIESYFYMWRLTKEQKYRDWGWEAAQALIKHCKAEAGFTGVKDVYSKNPAKDDVQQSYFLAETLKYLYLLFSEDDLVNLNEFVFNTEAHPLPIST